MHFRRPDALSAFFATLLFLTATAADATLFQPLGIGSFVPSPGQSAGSVPTDISADGSVVVGWVYEGDGFEIASQGSAFRWEDGDMSAIPQCSIASSVSADGSIVAGSCNEDLYWRDGQLVSAGIWVPGTGGSVEIVSGNGAVLFGARTALFPNDINEQIGLSQAIVASPSEVAIGTLPGDKMSLVVGASFDGSVAAVSSRVQQLVFGEEHDELHAARWNGSLTDLGSIVSNPDVFVIDVSSDGTTLIGFNGRKPWRWTQADGMVAVDFPEGGNVANARGVNEDGSIIVGAWSGRDIETQRAYIWTEADGSRDLQEYFENDLGLDLEGWHLLEANAVSDDGTAFAGIGFAPDSTVATGWVVSDGCALQIEVSALEVPYAAAPVHSNPAPGVYSKPGGT